jgi:hypothetical protein
METTARVTAWRDTPSPRMRIIRDAPARDLRAAERAAADFLDALGLSDDTPARHAPPDGGRVRRA